MVRSAPRAAAPAALPAPPPTSLRRLRGRQPAKRPLGRRRSDSGGIRSPAKRPGCRRNSQRRRASPAGRPWAAALGRRRASESRSSSLRTSSCTNHAPRAASPSGGEEGHGALPRLRRTGRGRRHGTAALRAAAARTSTGAAGRRGGPKRTTRRACAATLRTATHWAPTGRRASSGSALRSTRRLERPTPTLLHGGGSGAPSSTSCLRQSG
mmetsp:Transcript_27125/g.87063  ORF Transcript_27125/g.87063 Transcript_27125/m.87063 type:complete len:211 (+) Transcript_27125:458-1090(+)